MNGFSACSRKWKMWLDEPRVALSERWDSHWERENECNWNAISIQATAKCSCCLQRSCYSLLFVRVTTKQNNVSRATHRSKRQTTKKTDTYIYIYKQHKYLCMRCAHYFSYTLHYMLTNNKSGYTVGLARMAFDCRRNHTKSVQLFVIIFTHIQ